MDILVKFLNKYNFIRLSVSVRPPVVIHCVPGAGKTSLIREIIQEDNRFIAYTYGVPDQPNLEGCWIRKIPEKFSEDKLVLVDEYTLGDNFSGAFAVFGDPLQSNKQEPLAAHFVCKFSHRFGSNTATFLRSLGYKIEAEGADSVEVLDIFEAEPEGQVVYFETEVGELLCKHGVEAKRYTEIIGQTFDCVTFVTSENQPLSNPVATFQCATRHRRKLLILCPDASYSSA